MAGFKKYGWSFSGLLDSNTKVMAILKPYLQPKRPHADDGSGDSEPQYKRWHVDKSRVSASLPDHDFPATSLNPGSNDFDQATSSSSSNTIESIPGSNSIHLISFDTRNGTRDLTDATTMGHLDYTFNSSDELTDTAIASILGYTVNSPDEFTDPSTASNLGYTINSSGEITDLDTAGFLQSTHDQSIDVLSNLDHKTDPSAVEHLRWTVNGLDTLTDPSTERFLQGATSPNQVYLMGNFIYQSHDQHLPNASKPGWIRSTDDKQSDGSWYTGQS